MDVDFFQQLVVIRPASRNHLMRLPKTASLLSRTAARMTCRRRRDDRRPRRPEAELGFHPTWHSRRSRCCCSRRFLHRCRPKVGRRADVATVAKRPTWQGTLEACCRRVVNWWRQRVLGEAVNYSTCDDYYTQSAIRRRWCALMIWYTYCVILLLLLLLSVISLC